MSAEPSPYVHPFADVAPISAAVMRMAHLQRSVAAARLTELGLFPGQELVLAQLWDEPRSQKELVRSLGLDHSTIAKSVQRLERSGFVTRQPSPTDGRVVLVTLTDSGRALRQPVAAIWTDLESRWTAALTTQDHAAFAATLTHLTQTTS